MNGPGLHAMSDTLPDTETQIEAADIAEHDTTWKDAAMLANQQCILLAVQNAALAQD